MHSLLSSLEDQIPVTRLDTPLAGRCHWPYWHRPTSSQCCLAATSQEVPSCHVFVSPGHFQPLCRVEHISPDRMASLSPSLSPQPWSSPPATSPSWPTTLFGALS